MDLTINPNKILSSTDELIYKREKYFPPCLYYNHPVEITSAKNQYYNNGQKFQVLTVNKAKGSLSISGHISPDMATKKVAH